MAGELEQLTRDWFEAFDRGAFKRVMPYIAAECVGVDEISRHWMRGSGEVRDYVRKLADMVSDVRTKLSDVNEQSWGETGLLTCWLEQDYVLDGKSEHVSAPTTLVYRREGGGWKMVLFHSIPLPPAAG